MTCCEHEAELNRLREKLERLEWEEQDRRKEAGFQLAMTVVYFIRCESFVKIGISRQPEKRLKHIRKLGACTFPKRLDIASAELVATIKAGADAADLEKGLHKKFAHLRHTGEWFTESPELTEYIEQLKESPNASNAA